MTRRPIRVLIVEDHVIVRKGLCALLALENDVHVVGEANDGEEALEQLEQLRPDVILMDLVMPGMDGIEAIRQIMLLRPASRVLVLTAYATDDKLFAALRAGAIGYLLKDVDPEKLVQAIRQVSRGESSLHPTIARRVLHELVHPPDPTDGALTERELEVLRLIAQGLNNREIAERLVISEPTVRTHVSNMLGKLHLSSRTQAAVYALREGLAQPVESSQ